MITTVQPLVTTEVGMPVGFVIGKPNENVRVGFGGAIKGGKVGFGGTIIPGLIEIGTAGIIVGFGGGIPKLILGIMVGLGGGIIPGKVGIKDGIGGGFDPMLTRVGLGGGTIPGLVETGIAGIIVGFGGAGLAGEADGDTPRPFGTGLDGGDIPLTKLTTVRITTKTLIFISFLFLLFNDFCLRYKNVNLNINFLTKRFQIKSI